MSDKPPKPWPPLYAMMWPRLVTIAREQGYCLALHGSMQRDLDAVAVPWTEEASEATALIAALVEAISPFDDKRIGLDGPTKKPHGRLAWSITMGSGAFMDVSVTPRIAP